MARAPYRKRCEAYFSNEKNRPYSVLEACEAMGIDYPTLQKWEAGADRSLAALARQVKAKVAVGWEKGDVSPSMAVFLLKNYMGHSDRPSGDAGPLAITLRVERDGA